MCKVEFIAMRDLSTVGGHWISTELFVNKSDAMTFAQTIARGLQNSPFTVYYRIVAV